MDIRKIIREEVEDDFQWIRDIDPFDPYKPIDGNIFFIVDNGTNGHRDNKATLRYLMKLGGTYIDDDGEEMIETLMADEDSLDDLRYWESNQNLDNVNWVSSYEMDGEEDTELELAQDLINKSYWRPWFLRHQSQETPLKESDDFDWIRDIKPTGLYPGAKFIVNIDSTLPMSAGEIYHPFTREDELGNQVIITILDVRDKMVLYDTEYNYDPLHIDPNPRTTPEGAQKLIDAGYWQPY